MLCPLGHLWTLESPMRHTLPGNWGLRTGMPSLTNTAANTPPSLTYTIMLDICYGTVQLRSTWTVFQIVNSSAQQSGGQLSDIVIDCWHAGHLVSSKRKNKKDQKEEGKKVQLLNIVDMPMQHIRFPKKNTQKRTRGYMRQCQIRVRFESGVKTKFLAALNQLLTSFFQCYDIPWSHSFPKRYDM